MLFIQSRVLFTEQDYVNTQVIVLMGIGAFMHIRKTRFGQGLVRVTCPRQGPLARILTQSHPLSTLSIADVCFHARFLVTCIMAAVMRMPCPIFPLGLLNLTIQVQIVPIQMRILLRIAQNRMAIQEESSLPRFRESCGPGFILALIYLQVIILI